MLFTSHLLAGAAIGGVLPIPVAAGVVGFGSHVAMDVVPHWGDRRPERFLAVARVDGLTALAMAGTALAVAPPPRRPAVLAGMVGAGLLDLDKPTRHFFGRSVFPAAVDAWHSRIQVGREAPGRLSNELAAAAGLVAVVLLVLRRR